MTRNLTRNLTKGLIALGFVGALAIGTATPSVAQGVYFSGPGFDVGIGAPRYRHHYYYGSPYRQYWRHGYYRDWDGY